MDYTISRKYTQPGSNTSLNTRVVCIHSTARCADATPPGRPLFTTDPKCIVKLIYKTRVYGSYTLFNAYIQSFRIVFGVTCIRPLEYMYMPCGLRIHVETVADFVSGRAYTTFTQYTVIYVMKPVEYMKGENLTENRGKTWPYPAVID